MKNWTIAILTLAFASSWCSAQRRERSRDRERSTSTVQVSHSDTGDFSQDYSIFGDLNIFQKDRHAPKPAGSGGAPPLTLEQTYVLTGIVQDMDNQYRANFEDLSRGAVQKVSVGSALAHGTVSEIQHDQIAYEASGKKVWVQIGNNLTGGSATPSGSSPDSAGPAVDPNTPGLTIEQRMRARRMAQVNGGGATVSSNSAAPAMPNNNMPQMMSGGQPPPFNGQQNNTMNGPPQGNGPQGNSQQGSGPQGNGQPDGSTPGGATDGDDPVINHNFPALPTATPNSGQGNP